jgi:hypothetical protein
MTEVTENQTQNLILQVVNLQCKLNSQPCSMWLVDCKEGIGSQKLKWNLWEDPDEAEDMEPLNSGENFSVGVTSLSPIQSLSTPVWESNTALPKL